MLPMTDLIRFAPARPGEPEPDFGLGATGFAAWRALIVSHALVTRRLQDELLAGHDLTLADYDALVQLAYAPDRTLRMSALAERVLLSRSGVTRLVDRLVRQGFVARIECPSDARGTSAVLTPAGLEKLREASPTHLDGVRRHFLSGLSEEDRRTVATALEAVVAHVDGPDALAACDGHAAIDDAVARERGAVTGAGRPRR